MFTSRGGEVGFLTRKSRVVWASTGDLGMAGMSQRGEDVVELAESSKVEMHCLFYM